LALIAALATIIVQWVLWCRDKESEKRVDRKVKEILLKELNNCSKSIQLNKELAFERDKGGDVKKIIDLEVDVFQSVINTPKIFQYFSDELIDYLFKFYYLAKTFNRFIKNSSQGRPNFNPIIDQPAKDNVFIELIVGAENLLEKIIPKIESIDIK
jgi:hypothetical protein